MQYKVLHKGHGTFHPTVDSNCECHYRGTLIDGTEFDSSYKRGRPATFAPQQVIKGWTEAMQLMVEGDKWELYIPAELAYGNAQRGQFITPGSVLLFELEILTILGNKIPKKSEL
uniref:peptidylprolyl isomerase n=1 Tax=Arcella intermedia TaxID=1963864 RepID=A0A6B2LQE6_9EUKA